MTRDKFISGYPVNWEKVTLGDVCDIYQGYGFPKFLQGSSSGKYPFYKVGDISNNVKAGYRNLEFSNNHIDDDVLLKLKAKLLPPGTIVFAKIGEGLKLNRRAIIKTSALVDNNVIGLKSKEQVCHDLFLFYFLTTVKLEDYAKATTVPSVRKSDIEQIPFILPPKIIQQQIVSKIEELFSELDKGIETLRSAQQQLKTYRQSVLKWAFEGRLTEEWRKANHLIASKNFTASITKERELSYNRKLEEWAKTKSNSVEEKISKPQRPSNLDPKNDLFEGLIEKETIPIEWKIVPLVFVSDNQPNSIVDGPFGSSINVNEDYIDSGVPVIRMVNIRPFRFVQDQMKFIKESKFQSLRRHNILPNDILIAKVGATIGDCCIYPINQPEAMLSTTGSCRIRLDKNVMNSKFLEYYISFHRNTLKDIASQTAQPFLNMKVLKSFPVVLPTIAEQNNIVEEIENLISIADKMEESIEQSLKQAEVLRQSILKMAFEGRI